MGERLTSAQRRALELIAPRLPFYGSAKDWRGVRHDVKIRLWSGDYLSTPNMNRDGSGKWELTALGRRALANTKDQDHV